MFEILKKIKYKLPVFLYDILAIPIAWFTAYAFRYNLQPYSKAIISSHSLHSLVLLMAVQTISFYYFRTYRGVWRFFSLNDLIRLFKATFTAVVLVIPVFYATSILHYMPRSVLPLYALFLTVLLCGGRLAVRVYWDRKGKGNKDEGSKRVLIVGAGRAGESLVRDLKRGSMYLPIGFMDDLITKKGMEVHGVPVLGPIRDLPEFVAQFSIDLIFIAIPSARSVTMRRIVSLCESSRVPFRTLPSLPELASGRVEVNLLRPVNIEDLLGRDEVTLEWDRIASAIKGKRILVTGGGGSIGSELCRQVLALEPASLAIIEHSEFNLYQIEQEIKEKYPSASVVLGLMSVTDPVAVNQFIAEYKPELVFHAAAYKHVPMLQDQVRAAVVNNVLGTQVIANACVMQGVDKFILISTDKAVNPTNIMGTSKRVAEIFCQNLNQRVQTQFITVRFGNVLGSAGSVLPIFYKQLQSGGPITVTHPDMQRYFMTIPEACQLILQAMVNGVGGEIFVLDMGEPVKISYLAEQMIRLAGKEPGKDILIEYTGLRPGEKLFEELFHESEELVQTDHEKLYKAKFRALNWSDLMQTFRLLEQACAQNESEELLFLLKSLVPELKLEVLDVV